MPHAALAPYRAWVDAGAVGLDPIEATGDGHCPPLAPLPIHAYSADLECAHGRVPIEGCEHGCHAPQALGPAPSWIQKETPDLMTAMKPKRAPKKKRPKPAPVSPLLVSIVADLDAEIARLTAARDRLKKFAA